MQSIWKFAGIAATSLAIVYVSTQPTSGADMHAPASRAAAAVVYGSCADSPCIDVDPEAISAVLDIGDSNDYTLNIGNAGTQTLEWSLFEPEPRSGGAGAAVTADGSREFVAGGGESAPLIGFTLKAAASSAADPQNWTRISQSSGMMSNVPDDTGAATDVALEWGVLWGTMTFEPEGTVATGAVPQHDYDLTGMNGYTFGPAGHYFFELSGLTPGAMYEYWFVGYRNMGNFNQTVQVSNGDTINATQFTQAIASANNDGRFVINASVADQSMHFDDLAFVTTASPEGTIRFEVQRIEYSTSVGAIAIRQALNCEIPDWITSITPATGTVPAGPGTDELTVTLDAGGLAPGTHTGTFCIASNDPARPVVPVPVALEVELGAFTAIQGVVTTSGYCNASPGPVASATVAVFDSGGVLIDTLSTDMNGFYQTFSHAGEGPLAIEVSATGHFGDQAAGLATNPGATVTENFELEIDAPCADFAPDAHVFKLLSGDSETQTLTILNTNGNAALDWNMLGGVRGGSSVLWDAGPLVTHPGIGPDGTDFSTLQDALGMSVPGYAVTPLGSGSHFRVADEFEVTGAWLVDTITFFAYQTGSPGGSPPPSTITSVNYRIWDGPPDDPASNLVFGDTTTNRLQSTEFSNIYRILLAIDTARPIMTVVAEGGFSLSPGSYWVDWQIDGSLASGTWQPPITILGETTTGHAKQLREYVGWQDAIDEDPLGLGTLTPQGMPFIISGTAANCWNPADIDWLDAASTNGTVAAGGQQTVDLTASTTGLTPGEHNVALCIYTDDTRRAPMAVPVTLIVEDTDAGMLEGVVSSGGHCNADSSPIEGALVTAVGATSTFETTTDENGHYWIPGINENESPLSLTVSAHGHLDGTETGVTVGAMQTTTADFELVMEAPCATAEPHGLSVHVGPDGVASRTLTIGNVAGGAELEWALHTAEAPIIPVSRPAQQHAAPQHAGGEGSARATGMAEIMAGDYGVTLPSLQMITPRGAPFDCDGEPGVIIQDDGTVEDGYAYGFGNSWVMFVDHYAPSAYPATFTGVCIGFITMFGPTSLDIEIVVFADDGPGGEPGTELGALKATVAVEQFNPPVPPPNFPTLWNTIDISAMELEIHSGGVYIGARWTPVVPDVFIASDQSGPNPPGFAGGYGAADVGSNGEWAPIVSTFANYRALMVRPIEVALAGCSASPEDIPWLSVDPETGTTAAGGTSAVSVSFNAAGLAPGDYQAVLCVNSNDAANPLISVPVALRVVDESSMMIFNDRFE